MSLTKGETRYLKTMFEMLKQPEKKNKVPPEIAKACEKELHACEDALMEINRKDISAAQKAAEKKQVYEIMEDIRKASGGKLKVGWWESFRRKNMPELAAAVYGSGVALALTLAVGVLKLSTLGAVGAAALGLVAVANPIGAAVVGGALAIAVAAVVVWAAYKCLSAGYNALKNWATGAKAKEANEVTAARERLQKVDAARERLQTASSARTLQILGQTQQNSGVVVVIQSGTVADASKAEDVVSRWQKAGK